MDAIQKIHYLIVRKVKYYNNILVNNTSVCGESSIDRKYTTNKNKVTCKYCLIHMRHLGISK